MDHLIGWIMRWKYENFRAIMPPMGMVASDRLQELMWMAANQPYTDCVSISRVSLSWLFSPLLDNQEIETLNPEPWDKRSNLWDSESNLESWQTSLHQRQDNCGLCTTVSVVRRAHGSWWCVWNSELKTSCYIHRLFQVGIAMYQLAKLRILEFYYDFFDHFIDCRDFDLLQIDTDNLYSALSTIQNLRPWLSQNSEQSFRIARKTG